jgi:hypothetical protein
LGRALRGWDVESPEDPAQDATVNFDAAGGELATGLNWANLTEEGALKTGVVFPKQTTAPLVRTPQLNRRRRLPG